MYTTELRDWATRHGDDVEPGADRTLGLSSKLIRFHHRGVPTVAVGTRRPRHMDFLGLQASGARGAFRRPLIQNRSLPLK